MLPKHEIVLIFLISNFNTIRLRNPVKGEEVRQKQPIYSTKEKGFLDLLQSKTLSSSKNLP